jgi:hypothetical protein
VKIWHDVMQPIVSRDIRAGGAKTSFPLAPGVIRVSYCPDSGLRPTDACRADVRGDRTTEGYFIQGTEPRSYCDRQVLRLQTVEQNVTEEGTLPPEELRRVGLLRIKRNLPSKIYVADQRYAVS